MVRVPSLSFGTTSLGVSDVNEPQSNVFNLAGAGLQTIGALQVAKEERDSKAYNIQAQNDLRMSGIEALEAAKNEAETPDDITPLFFEKFEAQRDSILEGAPNKRARKRFNEIYETTKGSFGERAISIQVSENQAVRLNQIEDAMQSKINVLRNGGNYGEISQLLEEDFKNADGVLSPSQLQDLRDKTTNQSKGAHLDYLFERGKLNDVKRLINDKDFNKDLTSRDIGSYRIAIKRQREENIRKARAARAAVNTGAYLDPKNKKNKKAIDVIYNQHLAEGVMAGNPAAQKATVEMISNWAVIPPTLMGQMRSADAGNNPNQKAAAYQMYVEATRDNPSVALYSKMPKDFIERANAYINMTDSGYTERETFAVVDNIGREEPAVVKYRKGQINELLKEGKVTEFDPAEYFDEGFLSFEPSIMSSTEQELRAEVESAYKTLYPQIGDDEQAAERAKQIAASKFGVSKVSGSSVVMKYPPEKIFKIPAFKDDKAGDLTSEIIGEQLLEDVRRATNNNDIDIDDIILDSDHQTDYEITRGEIPTYRVIVTENGKPTELERFMFETDRAVNKLRNAREEERQEEIKKDRMEEMLGEWRFK